MGEPREELCIAIGLSQSQFANPDGDGLDSAALLAAIDAYTVAITRERDALLEEAREALEDAVAGLRYIRIQYGEFRGVGWDRIEQKYAALLSRLAPTGGATEEAQGGH